MRADAMPNLLNDGGRLMEGEGGREKGREGVGWEVGGAAEQVFI